MRVNYAARIIQTLMELPEKLGAIELVTNLLTPDDFLEPFRDFYIKILDRYEQGKPYNYVTMVDLYPTHGAVKTLLDIANQQHYDYDSLKDFCQTLKRQSQLRKLNTMAQMVLDQSKKTSTDVAGLVQAVESTMLELEKSTADSSQSTKTLLTPFSEYVSKNRGKTLFGFSTGFPTIDKHTKGLQLGSYWIIGGETSIGKTWFAQKLLLSAIGSGANALYISLELSNLEMLTRFVSTLSRHSLTRVKSQDLSHDPSYQYALDFLETHNLSFNDTCATLSHVVHAIKSAKRKQGVQVVVVDYLQNVNVEKTSEYDRLNQITLTLQRLAVAENICIIALSQLSRDSIDKDSSLHAFKGSGNLENSADVAVLLFTDKESEQPRVVAHVSKNRLLGETGAVSLIQDVTRGDMYEPVSEVI